MTVCARSKGVSPEAVMAVMVAGGMISAEHRSLARGVMLPGRRLKALQISFRYSWRALYSGDQYTLAILLEDVLAWLVYVGITFLTVGLG